MRTDQLCESASSEPTLVGQPSGYRGTLVVVEGMDATRIAERDPLGEVISWLLIIGELAGSPDGRRSDEVPE